jgi:hypothetical protein
VHLFLLSLPDLPTGRQANDRIEFAFQALDFWRRFLENNGALPQTPVHSFSRKKERNQENAPRRLFLDGLFQHCSLN